MYTKCACCVYYAFHHNTFYRDFYVLCVAYIEIVAASSAHVVMSKCVAYVVREMYTYVVNIVCCNLVVMCTLCVHCVSNMCTLCVQSMYHVNTACECSSDCAERISIGHSLR